MCVCISVSMFVSMRVCDTEQAEGIWGGGTLISHSPGAERSLVTPTQTNGLTDRSGLQKTTTIYKIMNNWQYSKVCPGVMDELSRITLVCC